MSRAGAPSAQASRQAINERRLSISALEPLEPLELELHGHEYKISADIDVDVVAQMNSIQEVIESGTDDEVVDALSRGRRLIHSLLVELNDDVPPLEDFRLKMRELLLIFTFVMGGQTPARQVAEALAGMEYAAEDARTGERVEGLAEPATAVDAQAEPVPLVEPSSERLSA